MFVSSPPGIVVFSAGQELSLIENFEISGGRQAGRAGGEEGTASAYDSSRRKGIAHTGEDPPLFFWRDRTGHEIDFLIDLGTDLVPVEAKSARTLAPDFFDGIRYWLSLKGNTANKGIIVYGGEDSYEREGLQVRAWFQCS